MEVKHMSRSKPATTTPCKRFFEWSGGTGTLHYYDKEKKDRVEVKLPFTFLILDELATITGFCEQDSSRYWSNEVRSISKDELVVKTSAGIKQSGLYKNLADVRAKGAKYAKSIYISFCEPSTGEWLMGNIKAYGAALTAWIEFSSTCVPMNGKVTITGSQKAKKGATEYYTPVFEYSSASSDENDVAFELDKELQGYLDNYLSAVDADDEKQEIEVPQPARRAEHVFDADEEPINLDDIPF